MVSLGCCRLGSWQKEGEADVDNGKEELSIIDGAKSLMMALWWHLLDWKDAMVEIDGSCI